MNVDICHLSVTLGLLPDNEDLRRRWGNEFGVPANSPFELLGPRISHDCAGAALFCAPKRTEHHICGVMWNLLFSGHSTLRRDKFFISPIPPAQPRTAGEDE